MCDPDPDAYAEDRPSTLLIQNQGIGNRPMQIRAKMRKQLEKVGVNDKDHENIVSNPQAIRYAANSMHQTGLLQHFQHVGLENEDDDDNEPIGLVAVDLGVEDDGY
ncbi:hypothetical protein PENVUL_c039G09384 [Penicillium vulpinum]|uniref:Uncharacterized protein n=1 Tax=Penicillium vulpinum TaxID=29845 RepID=A0A1V6RMS8_9EURO|nr:hypothetical protein PENVUL_c039G09384 [Penicillium vulpinum]